MSATMSSTTLLPLGIDLSKRSFDACLRLPSGSYRHRKFSNDLPGFQALMAWLTEHQTARVHACLEATGTYGEALTAFLHDHGQRVSVINPKRLSHFARSRLARAKTDRGDARLLADFCQQEQPREWTPPAPAYRELQALVRHRETLEEDRQRVQNRLSAADHPAFVRQSLNDQLVSLAAALTAVEQAIRAHMAAHPELQQQQEWLCSIPGIGPTTAQWVLAELSGGHGFRHAREAAAYAGLNPRVEQSGEWRGKSRLSKQGNARLRKALYYPALAALRWNPVVKEFAERLQERGKPKMAVVGAAMRKLLHLAFGVLHQQQAFDPAWPAAGGGRRQGEPA